MKKCLIFAVLILLFSNVFAQELTSASLDIEPTDNTELLGAHKEAWTGNDEFHLLFNEGLCSAVVTRISKPNNPRITNFVWEDYLLGAWFEAETVNLAMLDILARVSVYYPLDHKFNGMRQKAKEMFLYGADFYSGLILRMDILNFIADFQISVGPHASYLLTDEFHLVSLGGGVTAKASLPITRSWSVLLEGMFSMDYGNLGSNNDYYITFDYCYEYQFYAGFRYSRKHRNLHPYIKGKE